MMLEQRAQVDADAFKPLPNMRSNNPMTPPCLLMVQVIALPAMAYCSSVNPLCVVGVSRSSTGAGHAEHQAQYLRGMTPSKFRSYNGKPLWERVRLDRPLTDYSRVQQLVGSVIRNRWTGGAAKADYLNVGCGPVPLDGFVNLDYCWRPGIDVCWDLARPLPFADASLRGIYSEHCLEHISKDACQAVLREFHRILAPGGTLRVSVPDAEFVAREYLRASADGTLVEGMRPIEAVNDLFRYGHQYVYDAAEMMRMLSAAGFQECHRAEYRKGRDPKLLQDLDTRHPGSLYVEGVR